MPTSSSNVGRPVSLPRALAHADFAGPWRPEQEHATSLDVGPPARPQGAGAERLEGLQPAQVGERLAAPVQGQQAALL